MKWSIWEKLGAGFGLALLTLAVLGTASYRGTARLIETARRVEETRGILRRLEDLLYQMKEAEAGTLSYVVTGEPRSLEAYHTAAERLVRQVSDLRKLTAANPGQRPRLEVLARSIEARAAFLRELSSLRRNQGAAAAEQALRTGKGEKLTADVKKAIVEIEDQENESLKRREQEAGEAKQEAVLINTYGTFLTLLLVSLTAMFVVRGIAVPIRHLTEGAARIVSDTLCRKVDVKANDEIGGLPAPFGRIADEISTMQAEIGMLGTILDSIGDGVVVADEHGRFLLTNPAARQVLGSDATVISVSQWSRRCGCYRPDGVTPYLSGDLPLSKAVRGDAVDGEEMFLRHPEESQGKWASVTARPLRDQTGALWGSVTILRDDTERKEADKERQDSVRLLRTILESLPVAVWVTNAEGEVIMRNKAAAETWPGASEAGIEQYAEYSAVWADTRQPVQADEWALARALARGEPSVGAVIDITYPDGTQRTIWDSAVPIRDSSRQIAGAVVIHEDLTELKREEEKVRKLNQELERRATDLEAVNRELEAFSYSISHDLRAPLRAISGFSEALLEDYADKLDAEGKDYLQRVCAASQRLSLLIDEVLRLSRVTRSEMRRATVDISGLAQTIAGELVKTQPGRQVEFVIAPGLVASADAQLLRLVLENLLGNAWKFTGKQAQARIEVGLTEREGERMFFVRDNGAGFDMAYAGKLFGAFQRLHAEREFEGNGIGLATVQRIIHRHGGRVSAEGAVGRGATFYFTLSSKGSWSAVQNHSAG
jgi:PAS domain S-box-containing protein